jgi:hypothetical protein
MLKAIEIGFIQLKEYETTPKEMLSATLLRHHK